MLIFIDTEFTNFPNPGTCELISIGLAVDTKQTFYGERSDFNRAYCSDFVNTVVISQLGKRPECVYTAAELAVAVRDWLNQFRGEECVYIAYDYILDKELLWELLGGDVPDWLQAKDVWHQIDEFAFETHMRDLFDGYQHHALNDAVCNMLAYREKSN